MRFNPRRIVRVGVDAVGRIEIQVVPADGEQLRHPQSERKGNDVHRLEPIALDVVKEGASLLRCHRATFRPFDSHGAGESGDVPRDQSLGFRPPQGPAQDRAREAPGVRGVAVRARGGRSLHVSQHPCDIARSELLEPIGRTVARG